MASNNAPKASGRLIHQCGEICGKTSEAYPVGIRAASLAETRVKIRTGRAVP